MAPLDEAARAALMLAEYNRPRGPAGPMVSIDQARADLARAIAGRNAAEAEADRKRRAVENAELLLSRVEDDLRRFDAVDDEVEELQVDHIREWAANGGIGDPPSFRPPPDPAARFVAKTAAQNRRRTILAAIEPLRADAQAAEAVAAQDRMNVHHAAERVLVSRAETIAVDLAEREQECQRLRLQLVRLATLQTAPDRPLPLSNAVRQLTERMPANSYARQADPRQVAELRVQFDALTNDAELTLE